MTRVHPTRVGVHQEVVVRGLCSVLGGHQLFFDPFGNGVTFNIESTLQTAQARAFLAGFDDDFAFFWAVGVTSRVFAVLFTAGFATVALSAVWCEAEFDECVALAVWASEGDCNGHEIILQKPTT